MNNECNIRYLRVGSRLISIHTGELYIITKKSEFRFRLVEKSTGLPVSVLKDDISLSFKKVKDHK